MKRFVCRFLLIIIPILALAVGAELFARSIPNSYKFKYEWMEQNKDSLQTLILGNSSSYCAFIPSRLKKAFNLANSAQSLDIDRWLITKYAGNCPNLKTIILPIDISNMFALDFNKELGADKNRAIYYDLYMGYGDKSVFSRNHYELACPQFISTKIIKYITATFKGVPFDYQCDSLGRGTYYKRIAKDSLGLTETKAIAWTKRSNLSDLEERIHLNYDILEDIIKRCRTHKIRLILVSTPYWHDFNKHLDPKRLQLFYQTVNKLKLRYDVEYSDYREDARFVKNKRCFKDLRHLSDEGAELFTDIVKSERGIE